jgi:hypothetical protein
MALMALATASPAAWAVDAVNRPRLKTRPANPVLKARVKDERCGGMN